MRAVYQRLPALAVAASLACSLAACDRTAGRPPAAAGSALAAAELPLAPLLAGRSYALPQVVHLSPLTLGTELSATGVRAVALPTHAGERPRPLTPPTLDCRAVAAEPGGGRALVECAERTSGAISLVLYDARAAARLAAVGAESGERLLRWSASDGTLWTATRPAPDRPARLFATASSLARRPVATAPPGFELVAVAPEASLALFRRALDRETHEVVLHDWRRDESRLLLPTGADGRFSDLAFVDGGRGLLLLADDGGDAPRLERLELATGERRRWGPPLPCPAIALRAHADGGATVVVACDGRRSALRLDDGGAEVALPPPPSGTRVVDWGPAGGDALLLATAGERWPEEIGRSDSGGDFHPLTYGLAGRVDPASLPAPRPLRWASGGVELPGEIWPASTATPAAVVVWFEDAERPPSFGVHRPLAAALAARELATLVVRGRGDELPSRRVRRAADGEPFAAARADLLAAAAATAPLAPATTPRLLVGEGRWWGAAALALATRADAPYSAIVALHPDFDPVAPAAAAIAAADGAAGATVAPRWSAIDAARLAALAVEWRFPVELLERPTFVALDPRRDLDGGMAQRVAAAAAAGRPVAALRAVPRPWGARLSGEIEREIAVRLFDAARRAAR
jgi:hypothetical protein